MKLHLPKMLLTAVLAACVAPAWATFSGPEGVTYQQVTTATNTAQSPAVDTEYTNITGGLSITTPGDAEAVDIKLTANNQSSGKEYFLGAVQSSTLWLAGGRFAIGQSTDLSGAGDIYVNGGTLQIAYEKTLTNDITIGTSSFDGGWNATTYANIREAALLVGIHDQSNKTVNLQGALNIAESAKIAIQSGYELNLSGALTGSTDLEISHFTNDGDNDSTFTLSGDNSYTGNITLTGYTGCTLTLKLSGDSLDLQTEVASISVGSNTVLDLSAVVHSSQDNLDKLENFATVNNNTKITTSGTGYILLENVNSEITLPGNSEQGSDAPVNITALNKNYKVAADLSINGSGYLKNDGRTRTLLVGQDRSFVVTGKMSLVSNAVMDIAGGSVEAGSLALGHGGSYTHPYWGKINMSAGSLKSGTIDLRQNYANVINITGGTLEFTATNVINRGSNTASSVSIVGTSADKRVILKSTSADWSLDGASLSSVKVGNVTIADTNTHGVALGNLEILGSIVNNKKLTLNSGIQVAATTSAELSGTGETYINSTITNNGTLNITGTSILVNSDFYTHYTLRDGTISYDLDNGNGYKVVSGAAYYLVYGANASSTVRTVSDGTNTYTLENTDGTGLYFGVSEEKRYMDKFYVTNGPVDVVGTGGTGTETIADTYVLQGGTMNLTSGSVKSSQIDYTSGSINLASSSSTLVLDSATQANNNSLLTLATGSGNIEINATTTLAHEASTQITGDIIINSGKELILGRKANPSIASGETFGSVANIVLNGGTLSIGCDTTTLNKVSTKADSSVGKLYIWDMYGEYGKDDAAGVLTINELVVNSGMQIQSGWKSNLNIAALSGSGELQLQRRESGNNQVVTINAGTDYTGHLNLDGGSSMTLNLNIASGATTKIKTDNSSTIDKLTLAKDATLRYNTKKWVNNAQFEYTLKEVVVGGTNTAIKLEAEKDYWQGCVNIDKLTNAKDKDGKNITGSITLSGNAMTSARDVMYLKGGDFEGTITYKGATTGGGNTVRKHALNITSDTAAANAVIKLEAANTANNVVALGIASDNVQVRGLEGTAGTIYSGEQAHMKVNDQGQQVWNGDDFAADGTTRKLTIKTDGNNYATSAAIVGKLNISKSGSGKQTFSGNISDWRGNITVTGGELVFGNAVSVAEVAVTGGTLTIGTYTGEELTTENTLTVTSSASFGAGAKVNANLVLSNNTQLTMADALTMGSDLRLGKDMTLSGDLVNTIKSMSEDGIVDLFTGVDALYLGDSTTVSGALDATSGVNLSMYFNFEGASNYYLGYADKKVFAGIQSVPEPTTATLSLLALAGLAARRRRK